MSIRSTLADMRGGAVFSGSPKGLNDFYRLYQLAKDREGWYRVKKTTYDNPYIAREEIEALKTDLPARIFNQEIMADFIEDGGFFQYLDRAAILREKDKPEQHRGHRKIMALDWGQSDDFTVIGVGCCECNRLVDWERFNQMDYVYQREKIKTMYRLWGCESAMPERNSIGVPNIEILRLEGMNIIRRADG
jgi:hypothetical protein